MPDPAVQREFIDRMLDKGDREANSKQYHEATHSYYSIFQPSISNNPEIGLKRIVPISLYDTAAVKLRATATKCAERLVEKGCFLPDDSLAGVIGLPRGALNLYLISNQYDVFTECALQFAAEKFPQRNVKRFLMSSVRARLNNLRNVGVCAPLLAEEAEAFDTLAVFETRLHALLVSLHCSSTFGDSLTSNRPCDIAAS